MNRPGDAIASARSSVSTDMPAARLSSSSRHLVLHLVLSPLLVEHLLQALGQQAQPVGRQNALEAYDPISLVVEDLRLRDPTAQRCISHHVPLTSSIRSTDPRCGACSTNTSSAPERSASMLDLLVYVNQHRDPLSCRMRLLELMPDELLFTTRAVRRRLDFERPVSDETIRQCVAAAMQAPSGSNRLTMQFVVVRDTEAKRAIGDLYRQCYEIYRTLDGVYIGSIDKDDPDLNAQQARSAASADLLADRLGSAPPLVIPCSVGGRGDGAPAVVTSLLYAYVMPATWSFMLAARGRGLGTCWTSTHLRMEREVAEVIGIPFDAVQQVCLTPLAYTIGTDFKPARRPAPDSIIHWDRW